MGVGSHGRVDARQIAATARGARRVGRRRGARARLVARSRRVSRATNTATSLQTFVVVLRDGRMAANHDDVPAEMMSARAAPNWATHSRGRPRGRRDVAAAIRRFRRRTNRRRFASAAGFDMNPRPRSRRGRTDHRRRHAGRPCPRARWTSRASRASFASSGPTMGLVAGGVLLVGTALIASSCSVRRAGG